MRRFECTGDGSTKFWEVAVNGDALTVRFGRVGTDGQTKVKNLGSPEAAAKEEAKLVAEKTKKGYVGVGARESGAAATSVESPAEAGGAVPAGRAKTKLKWKPFVPVGVALATSPDGTLIVESSNPIRAGDAYRATLTIHREDGTTTVVPAPGIVGGLAVLPDNRIVASIQHDFPAHGYHYDTSGLALFAASGEQLAYLAHEAFAGAKQVTVDASGARLACRASPAMGHPRYLRATIAWLSVEDLVAGRASLGSVELSGRPVFGFDTKGTLWITGRGRWISVAGDSLVEHTPPEAVFELGGLQMNLCGLSSSGSRRALIGYYDRIDVFDGETTVFRLPENIATYASLANEGRWLLTAADSAKTRLNKQVVEQLAWPDARLREANVALWDLESGSLARTFEIPKGLVTALEVVEGRFVVVAVSGRKLTFIPWSELGN